VRICPECQSRYDDDVESCPNDGEPLVDAPDELEGNPAVREVQQAAPHERTSMIDLEAIEARRAARRAESGGDGEAADPDGDDDKTPPPEGPAENDVDATGTLQRSRLKRRRAGTKVTTDAGDDVSDVPVDRRVGEDPTNRDMSRRDMTKSRATGMRTRTKVGERNAGGGGTLATGMTRRTQMQLQPKKSMSGATATVLALLIVSALVAAIIVLSRLFAVLTVTTVPPGAEVKLDGEVVGLSPIQKRVRTGSHVIDLSLEGYQPFKEVVDVPTGGLPFLQPLQKNAPPPPPPPSAREIADELLKHALRLFEANDLEGAKNKLEEAKKLVSDHEGVLALLAKVDAEIAARADAFSRAQGDAAVRERLRQARVLTEEGRRLYEKSQLSPARDKLYQALKLDPGYPEPHRILGKIYNREDDVDKVRYHLERYLQLGGSDGDFKVREWLKAHPR
jgi:PEGA domain